MFDDLLNEYDDIQLVIVGNRFSEHDRADESLKHVNNPDGFVEITDASDEDLVSLYSNAYAGVLFSKYEGFGMPPIEAGLLGTPYIVSNRTSLPEIVDNPLCVVDIDKPEEVKASLRRLIDDNEYYNELKSYMYKRAQYFLHYASMNKIEKLYLAREAKKDGNAKK
jgi:glycosyltransferase involved in cell wall biosynthesis